MLGKLVLVLLFGEDPFLLGKIHIHLVSFQFGEDLFPNW